MLVVNDKELEDRNDSDISTNTLRIAEHGSFSRHTCYVIPIRIVIRLIRYSFIVLRKRSEPPYTRKVKMALNYLWRMFLNFA